MIPILPLQELDAILIRGLVYVLRRREFDIPFYRRLDQGLRAHYRLEKVFEEADQNDWMLSEHPEQDCDIELYHRNPPAGSG